jgi:hypothetical protein
MLFDDLTSPDTCTALRDALTSGRFWSTGGTRAEFQVLGVPVVLRALDPVGGDEAWRRTLESLKEITDRG